MRGRAHADLLHHAELVAELAKIAFPDRMIGDQGDRADQVFDGFLRTQGNGDTTDTEGGKTGHLTSKPRVSRMTISPAAITRNFATRRKKRIADSASQ